MSTSTAAQEIKRLRQEYERGLLSIIVEQDRRAGFEQIANAVSRMAGLTVAADQWAPIRRWLSAQQSGQLTLTRLSFGSLRDLGKAFKQLDGKVALNASGLVIADALLAPVLTQISGDLATLEEDLPGQANWFDTLGALAEALDAWQLNLGEDSQALVNLREGFARIQSVAQSLFWDDAKEVSESLMNLLDRLLDGTLAPSQDHYRVSRAALDLLETLSLPQADSAQPSQINDAAYEQVIERADVLASGGSFEGVDEEGQGHYPVNKRAAASAPLATVLEAIPPLVAETLRQINEPLADEELQADLEQLARVAQKLLGRLD